MPTLDQIMLILNKIKALNEHQKRLNNIHFGHGFKKTQTEDNEYLVTPEIKRKIKIKQKLEENLYNDFLEKRNRKDIGDTYLDNVKCKEKDYIEQRNTVEYSKENIESNKQMVDIDSEGDFDFPEEWSLRDKLKTIV